MKTHLGITAILSCYLLFLSCSANNRGELMISDASKDTVFVVETNVKNPSTLILKITGETDDSVKIYQQRIAGGKINMELRGDHYDPRINIVYKAYKAKAGNLKIEYYLP